MFARVYCWIFGHDWWPLNAYSTPIYATCRRCGKHYVEEVRIAQNDTCKHGHHYDDCPDCRH